MNWGVDFLGVEAPFGPSGWSVQKLTLDGFVVVAELKPCVGGAIPVAADGGRIVRSSDTIAGPVTIAMLDIPTLSPSSPTLLLAASSATSSWKRTPVELNFIGQTMTVPTGARKSILGRTVTLLPPADPSSIDTVNTVDVQLIDPDQWMTSCDDDALAAGANLALIGEELVQFSDVTPLGAGRFRLAQLLRGRTVTEWAISSHVEGEVFCMMEARSLQSIPLAITTIGKEVAAQVPGGDVISLIVRPRGDAIPSPSGGATVDAEARTSIEQILATLRQKGLIET